MIIPFTQVQVQVPVQRTSKRAVLEKTCNVPSRSQVGELIRDKVYKTPTLSSIPTPDDTHLLNINWATSISN